MTVSGVLWGAVYKTHGSLKSTNDPDRPLDINLKEFTKTHHESPKPTMNFQDPPYKKIFIYKNMAQGFKDMQKNPQENFTTVEIDPVSGEYIINIPEWICDEKGWYEGTEVNIEVENDCIIIKDVE
jgi:hypothetical protein